MQHYASHDPSGGEHESLFPLLTMQLKTLAPLALLAAASAPAQDLYVGGPDGIIRKGHPVYGDFQFIGVCGGPIDSMALDGTNLFIGDTNGSIYHYDSTWDTVTYAFILTTDATSMLVRGDQLLVTSSTGEVLAVDKDTGDVLETMTAPAPISASLIRGTTLYVGSEWGVVYRRDLDDPSSDFSFFGTCGGPIESMAQDDQALILGDSTGAIYRIDFASGAVSATYGLGGDNTAMVYHQGDVLLTSSDGNLRRVDAVDGHQYRETGSPFNLQTMVLREEGVPGTGFCFGAVCPCGNDDGEAGCANSLGRGALLRGTGTSSVSADDLTLFATDVPPNKFGLFFMSAGQDAAKPIGDGLLCTKGAGGFHRFGMLMGDSFGFYNQSDLVLYSETNFGPNAQLTPGSTWQFQLWYRDEAGSCGTGFNTTNAYEVTFTL